MMDKIQGILSDEESMHQVQELYNMLMGETASSCSNDCPQSDCECNGESQCEEQNQCQEEDHSECGCQEEEQACDDDQAGPSDGGFDFMLLFKIQELLNNGGSDKNSDLLCALKPHLSAKKQDKVDKAVKIMKLIAIFNVLKESGLLKDFDKMI